MFSSSLLVSFKKCQFYDFINLFNVLNLSYLLMNFSKFIIAINDFFLFHLLQLMARQLKLIKEFNLEERKWYVKIIVAGKGVPKISRYGSKKYQSFLLCDSEVNYAILLMIFSFFLFFF